MTTVSAKLSDEETVMLDLLAERFECSKSDVLRRAIIFLSQRMDRADEAPEPQPSERKIDAIGETTVEILRLLQQHSQQSADAIKSTRIWAQQSMFFGKALALKFEVREQALAMMKEQLKKEELKQGGATQ